MLYKRHNIVLIRVSEDIVRKHFFLTISWLFLQAEQTAESVPVRQASPADARRGSNPRHSPGARSPHWRCVWYRLHQSRCQRRAFPVSRHGGNRPWLHAGHWECAEQWSKFVIIFFRLTVHLLLFVWSGFGCFNLSFLFFNRLYWVFRSKYDLDVWPDKSLALFTL